MVLKNNEEIHIYIDMSKTRVFIQNSSFDDLLVINLDVNGVMRTFDLLSAKLEFSSKTRVFNS